MRYITKTMKVQKQNVSTVLQWRAVPQVEHGPTQFPRRSQIYAGFVLLRKCRYHNV